MLLVDPESGVDVLAGANASRRATGIRYQARRRQLPTSSERKPACSNMRSEP